MLLRKQKWPALRTAFIVVIMLSFGMSYAQVLAPDLPENSTLKTLEEQYQQGHYTLAAQSARQYLSSETGQVDPKKSADIDKATYYLTLSGLNTGEQGCVEFAKAAMSSTSNPVYYQREAFTLAQYYFKHNQLTQAITLYESGGIGNLSNSELADEKFEMAYCYFNDKKFSKAEPLLLAIKELKAGKYYLEGNYYYGLLAYNENKYKEALQSFNRIRDAVEYRNVVPYYIAEIYYFMGNRDGALRLADSLIKRRDKSYYDNELHLLAAQCLFENQHYNEAKPYFQYYYDHKDKIRKEDLYKMAYCDYRTSDWINAIEKFKLLSHAKDSLGQTSMYLLGDCYLKRSDKQSARNAFGICADMNYNSGQQEASMIIYAKISYEIGYEDDALRQLYALLKTFPKTQYRDEANTLISGLLVKTNNYKRALSHLEAVGRKDEAYWQVYQKAEFGFAVQEYRKGELNGAFDHFSKSLDHPVNEDYENAAYFWKGELAYRLHRYGDVTVFSQNFVGRMGRKEDVGEVSPLATTQHAYLNMGYAAMESQNYTAAQLYFSHAQQSKGNDAYSGRVAALKEADAVFLQKNYQRAITLYDKIISSDGDNADYARYQKCVLLGLLGKNNDKIALLLSMVRETPPSAYANHARYELAITYLETDKYGQALTYLQQLTDSVADKSFAPGAWMKTGFIYQQTNEHQKAIDAYKHVIVDYPASEDRLPALEALKNQYIEINQPAAYTQLLRENGLPSADSSSIDSTYYSAAETQFANGKMESARQALTNYLQQYPNGIFAIKAHYYKAESNYQLKNYKEALMDYNVILSGPWNDFFENSARHAAAISYDNKDFISAFAYYLKLSVSTNGKQMKELAYTGLMKSGYYSGKFVEASVYADSLLSAPDVSAETMNEAMYFKARSLQNTDSMEAATSIYRELSGNKNGDIAAESRYRIAEMLFKKDNLKDAEDAANETIKLSAGYDYWIVKSYLLLSDILIKQKDYFNANATLESIVKHTKIIELKQEAIKKLEEVKALEKHQSKLSEE